MYNSKMGIGVKVKVFLLLYGVLALVNATAGMDNEDYLYDNDTTSANYTNSSDNYQYIYDETTAIEDNEYEITTESSEYNDTTSEDYYNYDDTTEYVEDYDSTTAIEDNDYEMTTESSEYTDDDTTSEDYNNYDDTTEYVDDYDATTAIEDNDYEITTESSEYNNDDTTSEDYNNYDDTTEYVDDYDATTAIEDNDYEITTESSEYNNDDTTSEDYNNYDDTTEYVDDYDATTAIEDNDNEMTTESSEYNNDDTTSEDYNNYEDTTEYVEDYDLTTAIEDNDYEMTTESSEYNDDDTTSEDYYNYDDTTEYVEDYEATTAIEDNDYEITTESSDYNNDDTTSEDYNNYDDTTEYVEDYGATTAIEDNDYEITTESSEYNNDDTTSEDYNNYDDTTEYVDDYDATTAIEDNDNEMTTESSEYNNDDTTSEDYNNYEDTTEYVEDYDLTTAIEDNDYEMTTESSEYNDDDTTEYVEDYDSTTAYEYNDYEMTTESSEYNNDDTTSEDYNNYEDTTEYVEDYDSTTAIEDNDYEMTTESSEYNDDTTSEDYYNYDDTTEYVEDYGATTAIEDNDYEITTESSEYNNDDTTEYVEDYDSTTAYEYNDYEMTTESSEYNNDDTTSEDYNNYEDTTEYVEDYDSTTAIEDTTESSEYNNDDTTSEDYNNYEDTTEYVEDYDSTTAIEDNDNEMTTESSEYNNDDITTEDYYNYEDTTEYVDDYDSTTAIEDNDSEITTESSEFNDDDTTSEDYNNYEDTTEYVEDYEATTAIEDNDYEITTESSEYNNDDTTSEDYNNYEDTTEYVEDYEARTAIEDNDYEITTESSEYNNDDTTSEDYNNYEDTTEYVEDYDSTTAIEDNDYEMTTESSEYNDDTTSEDYDNYADTTELANSDYDTTTEYDDGYEASTVEDNTDYDATTDIEDNENDTTSEDYDNYADTTEYADSDYDTTTEYDDDHEATTVEDNTDYDATTGIEDNDNDTTSEDYDNYADTTEYADSDYDTTTEYDDDYDATTEIDEADTTEPDELTTESPTTTTTDELTTESPTTTTTAYSGTRLFKYGITQGDNVAFSEYDCAGSRYSSYYWWYRTYYAKEVLLEKEGVAFLTNNRCKKNCFLGISSSGYVTFREKESSYMRDMYVQRWPSEWVWAFGYYRYQTIMEQGIYMLAPFWSDTNYIMDSESNVFYHIYKKKKINNDAMTLEVFDKADYLVGRYTGEAFSASQVIVVTWENMAPPQHWWCRYEHYCSGYYYRYYYWWCRYYDFTLCHTLNAERNTFQLVVAGNSRKGITHSLYLYDEMTWTYPRSAHVGYYLSSPRRNGITHKEHTETLYSNLYWPYQKHLPYEIDTRPNPLAQGDEGVLFYTLANGASSPSYDDMCNDWYDEEMEQTPVPYFGERYGFSTPQYISYISRWNSWRSWSCPCDIGSVQADWRWSYSSVLSNITENKKICYVQRWSWWYTVMACCYRRTTGALMTNMKYRNAGHLYLFHPTWYWSVGLSEQYDDQPKKWCCKKSSNCNKFFELRQIDTCANYAPPRFTWFRGDPHITTIDGNSYTFNGLGEYWLIKTPGNNFTAQGRTERAVDGNGTEKAATIFSAIVASDSDGDTMQVQLNSTKNGITIYMIDTDITDTWFTPAADDDSNNEYQSITLTKVSNVSIRASFGTDFALTVTYGEGQLAVTTAAPVNFKGNTSGLLGVYNDDTSDDYTRRDGTTLVITAPESEIYSSFGEDWRTTEEESIFIYHTDETHASFIPSDYTPLFLDVLQQNYTTEEWQSFNDTCSGNTECMFDYAVTGNEAFAQLTLSIGESNQNMSVAMSNSRPVVSVSTSILNVTMSEEATLTVEASDNDIDDTTTLNMEFTNVSNEVDISSQANLSGNVFTWTPTSTDALELLFYATDSNGAISAETIVTIRLCECISEQGVCDFDTVRATEDPSSSFQLVECNCVSGWTGISCDIDIDGCIDNTCGCNETQVCTGSNTVCYDLLPMNDTIAPGGAYQCGPCNAGYEKRNGDEDNDCINLDECFNNTDNCNRTNGFCIDTDGSFECGCNSGYRLDASLIDCNDIDECGEGTASCAHTCVNTDGSYSCICESGYTLNTDNTTCTLDPSLSALCNASGCEYCRGNITLATVDCFCPDGYTINGDGTTCDDLDECTLATDICNVHSDCVNTNGSYECNCTTGYIIESDKRTCSACEEGYWGDGCTNLCRCMIGTDCNATTGCVECSDAGLTGGNCDLDLDECLSDPCGSNTDTCVNTFGSYRCPCLNGFERISDIECRDIDDCEDVPCLNGGECLNKNNDTGYTCTCVNGYTGTDCETDIDECSSSPCNNGATCDDLRGKYRCSCVENYYGTNCNTMRYEIINDSVEPDNTTDTSSSHALSTAALVAIGVSSAVVIGVFSAVVALLVYKLHVLPVSESTTALIKGKSKLIKVDKYQVTHAEKEPIQTQEYPNKKTSPESRNFSSALIGHTSMPSKSVPNQSDLRSPSSISIGEEDWTMEDKHSAPIPVVEF